MAAAMDVTANGTPDDPLGSANCPALCEKFIDACKVAVDASAACWKKVIAKFATVQAATCNVQSGAAKDACLDQLSADKENTKDSYVDGSRDNGRAYCLTNGLSTCLASCS